MSIMSAYYQPTSGYNWADDDEDDFDPEAFCRNSTAISPTLEELGPIQGPSAVGLDATPLPFIKNSPYIDNDAATRKASKAAPYDGRQHDEDTSAHALKLPGDPAIYLSSNESAWPFEPPLACLFAYNASYTCAAPAYPQLSLRGDSRSAYAAGWRDLKVRCGGYAVSRGETFMVARTRMRFELRFEEDVEEKKGKAEEKEEGVEEEESSGDDREEEATGAVTLLDLIEARVEVGNGDEVVLVDDERVNGAERGVEAPAEESLILGEGNCVEARCVASPSLPRLDQAEVRGIPSTGAFGSLWFESALLAAGTGLAIGAVVMAFLLRLLQKF